MACVMCASVPLHAVGGKICGLPTELQQACHSGSTARAGIRLRRVLGARAAVSSVGETDRASRGGGASSSATSGEYTPADGPSSMNFMTAAVNALFSFQPFFKLASAGARKMIRERSDKIGIPWNEELARLAKHDWETELQLVARPDLVMPEYYLRPFHAYDNGNLSWTAAWEAGVASKAVHAPIFDPERNTLDPEGDAKLRQSYHQRMQDILGDWRPRAILDIGCSVGLSTFALHETFPEAEVVGVDLSPYFVAVANFNRKERNAQEGVELPVTFRHAAGEETGLEDGSVDLVSICLVCHELPRVATKQIIAEARRVLRPGGALAIMEMNPRSPFLQKMVDNVFAFTAFKATEPYFDDYRTFPIEEAIHEAGFSRPIELENSPRHRTMVARVE